MGSVAFKGFGGVRLRAETSGEELDPSVLLVHGLGRTRTAWDEVASGLVGAGRRVVALDLRGHGTSEWPADGRYDFDAHVEDLRAVLAQLGTRPVVVAAGFAGWIATAALATDAGLLAAGLVLVDLPAGEEAATPELADACDSRALVSFPHAEIAAYLEAAARGIALPSLVVRGGLDAPAKGHADAAEALATALPDCERAEVADADLLVVTDRSEAFMGLLLDFLERKQPRASGEFRAGSDPRTLRDALGCFASGVTIVSTRGADGVPVGLTANSFTSLSLDPPLLLVCIAHSSNSAPALLEAEHFAVNVLQIGQQPASNRFASKAEDRFSSTAWSEGEGGVPILDGSLGSFECKRHAVHEGGDHFILIGEVVRATFEPRRDPLLFFRGKYRRLHFA